MKFGNPSFILEATGLRVGSALYVSKGIWTKVLWPLNNIPNSLLKKKISDQLSKILGPKQPKIGFSQKVFLVEIVEISTGSDPLTHNAQKPGAKSK